MKIQIKIDRQAIRQIENVARESAVVAMEKLRKDLNDSETMPFDTGDMQNNQTFVAVEGEDTINGEDIYSVTLVTGSPQARRLYYHPEYQFQQGHILTNKIKSMEEELLQCDKAFEFEEDIDTIRYTPLRTMSFSIIPDMTSSA